MSEVLDLEGRWPELFDGLDQAQCGAVVQSFAAAWHEGWVPNREDVELVTDSARGSIDDQEYARRVAALVERRFGKPAAQG